MDSSNKKRYVLTAVAAAAAGATGIIWLKRSLRQQGVAPTDFDAFLHTPVPAAAKKPAGSSAAATDFESFLKVQPVQAQPAATDFLSFLKDAGISSGAAQGGGTPSTQQEAAAEVEAISEDSCPILVLYGTEYGFAREIAEKLSQQLKDTGKFWPLLHDAGRHPTGLDLSAHQAALLVFSTQGDGVPPTEAREFCDWVTGGKAGQLPGLSYSVCALGDTSYTHFCKCGKTLDATLAAAGASTLTGRVDVDKEDWPKVDAWISTCIQQLTAALPGMQTFQQLGGVAAVTGSSGSDAAAAAASGYSKSRPYYARVVSVEGLCVLRNPDDKDTVKVELALEPEAVSAGGLGYTPGDALGIWPSNPPQAVDELLEQLGATGDEAVTKPTWHYQEQPDSSSNNSSVSLRHALTVCYDIKTPKAQPLLTLLLQQLTATAAADTSSKTDQQQPGSSPVRPSIDLSVDATGGKAGAAAAAADGSSKDSSSKLLSPSAAIAASIAAVQALLSADVDAVESYLSPRHVIDILQEHPAAILTPQQLLGVLRPLQPRLYSISSTPLEYSPANSGVAATIAVVRYTSLGKERQGVTSTQVAERLEPGTLLPVFISKNPDFRLPQNPATPIIMVGPGTGLAPFRSFILQRLLEQQQQQDTAAAAAAGGGCGPMHLFFGCRRRDQDFLYGQQLQQWHEQGALTLHTAFSREDASKVYVQQRLREAGAEVWRLLEAGGHFYVCGDAGSMAGAVETALLDIIAQHIGAGKAAAAAGEQEAAAAAAAQSAAQAYLKQLSDSGRYERDVWFS